MKARNNVITVLATLTMGVQALAAGPGEWRSVVAPAPTARAATAEVAAMHSARTSYIVQAPSYAVAANAVKSVGGRITHELQIINAVAATLNTRQHATLLADRRLSLIYNGTAKVAGYAGQPYVVAQTQANQLHSSGITGKGVTIAFVDTGLWPNTPLAKNTAGQTAFLQGYDAINDKVGTAAVNDSNGHGTNVTSIATNSALAVDGTYIGMAPDAARVAVEAFGANGSGTYANTIRGLNWILLNKATYNIRVVNMSFGATPQSSYWNDPINQAVMKLWQAGIVVVASAGNSGPAEQTITVPGNVPYVITVGAMTDNYTPANTADDRLASFSSTGPTFEGFVKPEIVAPGGHVTGIMNKTGTIAHAHPEFHDGDKYFMMSGTSQSAAVVSGVVALMLQAHPALTPDQVKCALMSSARPAVDATGKLSYTVFQQGAGQINAYDAVYSTNYACANEGLNISADIAGTQHYGGPAHQDAVTKNFYVVDANGTPITQQGYLWNKGYLWNQGYLWSKGYLWNQGYLWSKGYLWNQGYLWSKGYLWNLSFVPSVASASGIESWVSQE
ncbi:MAG: S8 family peptidase [Steroidobacteraceae bacterium]